MRDVRQGLHTVASDRSLHGIERRRLRSVVSVRARMNGAESGMKGSITLDHGEGGAASARLVRDVFLRALGGPDVLEDAAVVRGGERIAMTTDTFVVRPAVFPGGDIGKLAVCGTVNDLAVVGAEPSYLSAGFIL